MKVYKDNKVYVQLNDLIVLLQLSDNIPSTIFTKVFKEEVTDVDDSNRFNFYEFDNPKELEFFRSQTWIVDYSDYMNISKEDLESRAHSIYLKLQIVLDTYNNLSEVEKEHNNDLLLEYRRLRHEFKDLKNIALYKMDMLDMPIPEPIEKVMENIIIEDICETKEKSLLRRIYKSLNKGNK